MFIPGDQAASVGLGGASIILNNFDADTGAALISAPANSVLTVFFYSDTVQSIQIATLQIAGAWAEVVRLPHDTASIGAILSSQFGTVSGAISVGRIS